MDASLTSTSAVIDALGGTSKVAASLDVSMQNVSNWRGLDKFPAHTYVPIRTLLRKHGIEAPDSLWRMRGAA